MAPNIHPTAIVEDGAVLGADVKLGPYCIVGKDTRLGVVTRSEKGCVVATTDGVVAVPACSIDALVDTTGAGDLFAAGFLFGVVRGASHENAGRLGALAAAEVIQHIGARPQVSLKELAQANGLPV